MGISKDLNISPYYDDFDETKNFSKILFRPSVPIQARELTQLQTILQNQIERFGDNIYKEGTIIKGCSFSFDSRYSYVKLKDTRVDLQPLNVLQHKGQWVRGSINGIIAEIQTVDSGLESNGSDLNTFFIKYTNAAGSVSGYLESEVLSIYASQTDAIAQTNLVAQIAIVDAATFGSDVTGNGYAFTVSDGVIFQKGSFVRVSSQSIVVSKYTNKPDQVAIGFETLETVVSENNDTSLLDNASGFSNVNAPGAHRLQLTPTLINLTFGQLATKDNFFSLAEFEAGKIVKSRQLTQFSSLGIEFARRTKEESGNYVVEPFKMIAEPHATDSTKFNLVTSSGIGYVNGFRVENKNDNLTAVSKGLDTSTASGQALSINYGSFVIVKELLGLVDPSIGSTLISLRNTTGGRLTANNYAIPAAVGTEIGTARLVFLDKMSGVSGTPEARHRLYINDIKMNSGVSFKDVKSVWFPGSGSKAMADLVLEGSPALAVLKESSAASLLFSFASTALKNLANTSYVYSVVQTSGVVATTGLATITTPAPAETTFGINAALSAALKSQIIMTTNGTTVLGAAFTGTATASGTTVTGTGTSFLTDFRVGQYINLTVSANFRRIVSIAGNTTLTVDSAWTVGSASSVSRAFPSYTQIPLDDTSTSVSSTTGTISVDLGLTLASSLSFSVLFNAKKIDASSGQIAKTSTKTFVKIDTDASANTQDGPWCLGVTDVWAIDSISRAIGSYTVTNNAIGDFQFTTGQKDSHYGLSYLHLKNGVTLPAGTTIIVQLESFQATSSGGYFTVESYPVDDSLTPAADTIKTEMIPIHISDGGQEYDLRDVVDMRPRATNTATIGAASGVASINPSTVEVIAPSLKLPSVNQQFGMDITKYLGRIDGVIVDSFGTFSVIPGVSSDEPTPPSIPSGTMLIGFTTVPPFPTLTTKAGSEILRHEYTVLTKQAQQQRFTMSDIGSIDRRLSAVEYYTSLSLLEKSAEDMFIASDITGNNRFKHGIFVDNFETVLGADFTHPEFSVGYNQKESAITAPFETFDLNLTYASGTGVEKKGDLVLVTSTDVPVITQNHASKFRNTAESFWHWNGTGTSIPAFDNGFDNLTPPVSTSTSPAINAIIGINNNTRTSTRINPTDNNQARSGSSGRWHLMIDQFERIH